MSDSVVPLSRRRFVVTSAAAAAALCLRPDARATEMRVPSPDRIRAIVVAFHAAYETMDPERLVPFLTDDMVLTDPTFGHRYEGLAAWRAAFAEAASRNADVRIRLDNTVAFGNRAAVQYVASGRFRLGPPESPEWKPFAVHGATFFELRGEKIRRWYSYNDVNEFRKQLGLSHV